MTEDIRELDCVALTRDLPADRLTRGQTGAVMLVHNNGEAFEVEFPIDARQSVVVTVAHQDLLKLKGLDYSAAVG